MSQTDGGLNCLTSAQFALRNLMRPDSEFGITTERVQWRSENFTCSLIERCARCSFKSLVELWVQHFKQLGIVGEERPVALWRTRIFRRAPNLTGHFRSLSEAARRENFEGMRDS